VGEFRSRADPSARLGIPAHVTLLGPFMSAERVDDGVIARLGETFAGRSPIDLELTSVRRFPGVLYLALAPEDCCQPIADDLASAWREFPPYEGAFDRVIHHLTVARGLTEEAEREVESAVSPQLPISARIDKAQLVAYDADAYERALSRAPGPMPPARVLATFRLGR